MPKGIVKIGLFMGWVGLSLGSNRHSTRSSRVNKFLSRCRPNGRSKLFVSILWFGGSNSLSNWFEGKEQKGRENQAKKKLEMEKEREIKKKNSKNQISMSLEWR